MLDLFVAVLSFLLLPVYGSPTRKIITPMMYEYSNAGDYWRSKLLLHTAPVNLYLQSVENETLWKGLSMVGCEKPGALCVEDIENAVSGTFTYHRRSTNAGALPISTFQYNDTQRNDISYINVVTRARKVFINNLAFLVAGDQFPQHTRLDMESSTWRQPDIFRYDQRTKTVSIVITNESGAEIVFPYVCTGFPILPPSPARPNNLLYPAMGRGSNGIYGPFICDKLYRITTELPQVDSPALEPMIED